jgi:uncharacterized protein
MSPKNSPDPMTRFHIAPQSGIAFEVHKGEIVRIIDAEGEQVSDLVCFAAKEHDEGLSSGTTTDYNETIYLSRGDTLFSNRSNPMFKIVEDRVGRHIMLYAPCSQEMFRRSYHVSEPHPNCLDNMVRALTPYGIKAPQISTPFNIFMNISMAPDGKISIHPARSKPGDAIELLAEMDMVVAVTACSAGICNNFNCTSIDVEIFAGENT